MAAEKIDYVSKSNLAKVVSKLRSLINGKLSTSGGTLTGDLNGQHITATLLQTTSAGDIGGAAYSVGAVRSDGWLYTATPAKVVSDGIAAGDNVTVIGNKVSAKDTTYSAATSSRAGLMTAADKSKLDALSAVATAKVDEICAAAGIEVAT